MDSLRPTASTRLSLAAALFAGIGFALWILPWSMVDPSQWRWLLEGDPAQHFLGWHFFRAEPWSWPPGRLWAFGEQMGSSIVYTDSIPLLALLLKPFSDWLPAHFQYAGLWLLLGYALTAGLAWRCGWLATGRAEAALLLALFAVLSPMIAWRTPGHFALAAHWIIWWAVAEYLEPGPRIAWWRRGLLLVVAALVHAYLLFIALAIFGAEWLRRVWVLRQYPLGPALARAGAIGAVLVIAMALAGYFVTSDPSGGDRQYGNYGADLDAWWSSLNSARSGGFHPPSLARGLEGMHYLGAGILALLGFALLAAVRRGAATLAFARSHAPLILAAGVLALLAFTHRVGFDGRVVADLPLADPWLSRLSLFRGSGRMLWLADVGLMLLAVAAAFSALSARSASVLVGALLLVQIADLAPPLSGMRGVLAAKAQTPRPDDLAQPLVSPFWDEAGPRYRRLAVAPMTHAAPGWISLGLLAADRGWSINTGQFARAPWPVWRGEHEWLATSLAGGLLDPDTIYVLHDPSLLDIDPLQPEVGIGRVDGLWVVAPGWFPRGGCCMVPHGSVDAIGAGFTRGGSSRLTHPRIAGATVQQAIGLWEDGWAASRIAIGFDSGAATSLRVRLQVPPAIAAAQRLVVVLDGRSGEVAADVAGLVILDLPLVRVGSHLLRIDSQERWIPRDAGAGEDARALAWQLLDAAAVD